MYDIAQKLKRYEGCSMYRMSEEEKEAQIGKLVLEYSEVKGHLNHLEERLRRAIDQSLSFGQLKDFNQIQIVDGVAQVRATFPLNKLVALDGILSSRELVEIVESRKAKLAELEQLANRVRAVAPHLL